MLTAPFCIKVKIITQEVISWMGLGIQNLFFLYVSPASVDVPVMLKLQKSAFGIVC